MFMVKDFWAVPEYAELLDPDQQSHLSLRRRRRGHGQGSARRARRGLGSDLQEVRPHLSGSTYGPEAIQARPASNRKDDIREEAFGRACNARSALAGRRARMERLGDPQSLHHSDDRLPDRLQHLSADLFARLFLHRLPRLGERAGQLRRAAELPRAAQRPAHLEQLHRHREVRDRLGRRADDRRLRPGAAPQPRLPLQGPRSPRCCSCR